MSQLAIDDPILRANDMVLSKTIADRLFKSFPAYLWAVTADTKQGIADIRCMSLTSKFGYRLVLPGIYSASQLDREVVNAGGEILERFRASRSLHFIEAKRGVDGMFLGEGAGIGKTKCL